MVSERMTRDRLCKGMSSIRAMRTMQEQPWRDGLQRGSAHLSGWKRRLHESKRFGLVRLVRLAALELRGPPRSQAGRNQLEADLGGLLPRRHD